MHVAGVVCVLSPGGSKAATATFRAGEADWAVVGLDLIMATKRSSSRAEKRLSKPNHQVFVSHATADKWIATRMCERIESAGATTFRDDRDINGGDDIPDEIRKHIKHSKEFLVVLTPESVNRPWVLLEAGAAWGWAKIRIVVVLCHVKTDSIPDMLKAKKAVLINDFEQYVNELRLRVKR